MNETRRTAILLAAWVTAAIAAGVPEDRSAQAGAQPRGDRPPVVVNSGPECFAGQTAPAK